MRVDTEQLRRLLDAHRDAVHAVERVAERARHVTPTRAERTALVEASEDAADARRVLRDAVDEFLPALLDELETARALLTEVRERGLAVFGDPAQRIDLTRRVAAYLES